MRIGSIYAYFDPKTNRPVYVGLTVDADNFRRHKQHLKNSKPSKFERWLRSFPQGSEPKPIEIEKVSYDDAYVLHCREDHFMYLFCTLEIFGKGGFNRSFSTNIDFSAIGSLCSREDARRGGLNSCKNLTPELRQIKSRVGHFAFLGKKHTEEARQKISDGWKRRRQLGLKMNLSDEARAVRRQQAAAMRARMEVIRSGISSTISRENVMANN